MKNFAVKITIYVSYFKQNRKNAILKYTNVIVLSQEIINLCPKNLYTFMKRDTNYMGVDFIAG